MLLRCYIAVTDIITIILGECIALCSGECARVVLHVVNFIHAYLELPTTLRYVATWDI